MDGRGPPKTAVILATPINVEESRAQRLQRQQSRFRDRGGIFVPSSRSTLANILLGKASPLKKPTRRSRSRSVSPCKAKSHAKTGAETPRDLDPSTIKTVSRTSPQKQARQSIPGGETTQTKSVARKSNVVPKKANDPTQGPPQPPAPTKASKSSVAKETSTSKPRSKKSNHDNIEKPSREDDGPAKGVAKSKSTSNARPSLKASAGKTTEPLTSISTVTISKASKSTSSTITAEGSKPSRPKPRKSSDLYSGGSEDEYVPKRPAKPRKSTAKAKPTVPDKGATSSSSKTKGKPAPPAKDKKKDSGQLSVIAEEDEEEESEDVQTRPISVRKEPVVARPSTKPDKKGKKRAAPDDDFDVAVGPSKKRSKNVAEETEPALKHKSGTQVKAAKAPKKPPHKPAIEKDIDQVTKKGSASQEKTAEPKAATKAGKKPRKQAAAEDEEPVQEPRRKKAAKELKVDAPKKSSAKRPRNVETEDSSAEKPAKRKKVAEEESKPSKVTVKSAPPKKSAPKSTSKSSSANETIQPKSKTTKSKKSSSAPVGKERRTGPPKSVLQRIQNSQPDELDDEPDPIDFLS